MNIHVNYIQIYTNKLLCTEFKLTFPLWGYHQKKEVFCFNLILLFSVHSYTDYFYMKLCDIKMYYIQSNMQISNCCWPMLKDRDLFFQTYASTWSRLEEHWCIYVTFDLRTKNFPKNYWFSISSWILMRSVKNLICINLLPSTKIFLVQINISVDIYKRK